MKSSSGAHYIALDHLRALAAFLVFIWHFLHWTSGTPVPFSQSPVIFPLAILDEGHVGVALFMTLSGYLFAKLLGGRTVIYHRFLWNRALRLLPLLVTVLFAKFLATVFNGTGPQETNEYLQCILSGFIYPTLPNGGWSVTVEAHFYLALPLLMILSRRSAWNALWIILAACAVRTVIFLDQHSVQHAAYFTIIGRIDQFTLGILACQIRINKLYLQKIIPLAAVCFCAFYWAFDHAGGFMGMPSYPSDSPIWIIMSSIEGAFFALLIRWYDTLDIPSTNILSTWIGRIGEYSYSIYLLHMFFVAAAAQYIHTHITDISNFYIGATWGTACFLLTIPIAWISHVLVEKPFMRWRVAYLKPGSIASNGPGMQTRY
ncbi:acyltransferase [Ramlibacter sp. H39-3-26]|uniref:acyltransferase family protein n=1 Tax=Curvibacter soli TaxID=3031331 RepID=UPI0023DA75E3|nr:acyltransferase [Ramlibacter sp. H39-3-26]MDF1486391.1 acyltransferase [Ramlibacter sp. H39-3-26]